MNVYDFDGTIYNGDSTLDFYLYVLIYTPSLIRFVPKQVRGFFLYKLKKINKTEFKEYFFSFLSGIDTENMIEGFWNHNYHKIYQWYLKQQHQDDIIISASPEFLLQPICQRLGILRLIASNVDIHSGRFNSKNCHGEEKVRRLEEKYHVTQIDRFYSDSKSDFPLAQIAKQAYYVKNGTITLWEKSRK